MATFTNRSEPLVMCPYNPAHQVKIGRLQIHITKCKKNYPEKDLRSCPYSAEHMVPASELLHHINTCPKKTTVVRYITESRDAACTGKLCVPSYRMPEPEKEQVLIEENWDAENTDVIPLEQKISRPSVKPVFRNVQRMAPAERRHFYTSLHNQTEDVEHNVEEQPVENVEPPTLLIPRQPRSQPKVLQQILEKRAQAAAASSTASVVSTEEEQIDGKVKLMGIGRGRKMGNDFPVGSTEEEVSETVKLMGMGRGRKIVNGSS